MTRVELVPDVFDDFDRILDHLAHDEVVDAPVRIGESVRAVQVLSESPLIGRPVRDGKRELVIGRDSRGYVALYRFVASIDVVFVLAIRSRSKSGCKHRH